MVIEGDNAFGGGCQPFYPSVRPVTDEQLNDPRFKPIPPENDQEWLDFVRLGGAGDQPDTPEQQKARYKTEVADSVEVYPGLAKHQLRPPDLIATCSMDYTVRTFDCHNNYQLVQVFEGHFGMVNCVCAYRGTMLISTADDCTVRIWKRGTEDYGELLWTFFISPQPIKCLAPLPGSRAVCGGLDKILRIISLETGNTLIKFREYHGDDHFTLLEGCGSLASVIHLRENIIVSGADDSSVRLWDIDKGKCIGTYRGGHPGYGAEIGGTSVGYELAETFAAAWNITHLGDGGKLFASCSYDRTITVWDATDAKDVKVVRNWRAADNGIVHISLVAPDVVAVCSGDKHMRLYNWKTAEHLHTVRTDRGIPMCTLYLNDHLLAMCGGDSTIRIMDWKDKPKDLLGETGFNAHEFIISDCAAVYYDDEDDSHWTADPILYATEDKAVGDKDAEASITLFQSLLQDALQASMEEGVA